MSFVHLHTHSHYSLLDGLAKIPELVAKAKEYGMPALAITDHGNLYGAVEFYKAATKAGIKPIIGIECYIAAGSLVSKNPGVDDKRFHLILLAQNNIGYKNLVKLVTISHLEGFYYKPRMDKNILAKHAEGLIALSGCMSGEISRALISKNKNLAEKLVHEYQDIFGKENFYIELAHHPNLPNQKELQKNLRELAARTGAPAVATQDVHYLNKDDAQAQDVLLAIQTNTKLDDEDRLTMKSDDFSLASPDEMRIKFSDIPEAIENTLKIADKINIKLDLGGLHMPQFEVPDRFSDHSYLEKLAREHLDAKFGSPISKEYLDRLEYELDFIKKTNFSSYFLVVQDFVNWAKNSGIIVGPGRGSAASSLVSYVLNITNIDPIKYGLLFERFINPERVSPPDIDIDFADTRRDEVIEYARQKYGRDHVAQIITFGTMAARAAIRDAGRALGLSYAFCDQTAKMIPFGNTLKQALEANPEFKETYKDNPDSKRLIDAAKKLEGVARHASVHACGVVIAKESLSENIPLQYATRGQDTQKQIIVTQYEMHAIEDMGFLKMDFLGLKNLSIIEDAINLIRSRTGQKINIDNVPLDDESVFKTLSEGKTVGIFQFEGGGMTRYLVELQPTRLEDLIAMVALFRPGPMELIPRYIARRHGQEQITYLHPKLKPILESTYGVITYQEQLMQIMREMAGFSFGGADLVRKAVGKKIKQLLDEQIEKFIIGVEQTMGSRGLGEKLWKFVEPFARYGFNKAHSAGYALIAYQTAYLKTHFPLEFMTALLNSDEKDVERISFLVSECSRWAIKVLPPDINQSEAGFSPYINDSGEAVIRFGLRTIKNVGANVVEAIISERKRNGPYRTLTELLERLPTKDLNKKSIEALVKCGALDSLGERNQMLENMENILGFHKESAHNKNREQSSLFAGGPAGELLASLKLKTATAASSDERLRWEKELLGLYVSGHPLDKFRKLLESKSTNISSIKNHPEHTPVIIGGVVESMRKILTKKGDPMVFVKLLDLSDSIEVVVFPRVLKTFGHLLADDAGIALKGSISHRNGQVSIIADALKKLEPQE